MFIAWFAWKHLPEPGSLSTAPISTTVERVYLGPSNSLAVLQFKAVGEAAAPDYLARGVVRELVDMLAVEPSLQVTAATSSLFPEVGLADPNIAAQRLQVAHLLTGTVELEDDRLRLKAALWDAKRKETSWESGWESGLGDVDQLLDTVAANLLEQLPLNRERPAPTYGPVSPEAWLAYLRGRDLAAMGSFADAQGHFDRAVATDPQYQAALLERARLALMASPPDRDRALDGIESALTGNPGSPRALGLRSYIERNIDWDWQAAADSALEAVRLAPGDAGLLNLAGQALFSIGRHREAAEHFSRAIVRDPLNLNIRPGLGLAQEYQGEYDEALKTYRVLLGLKPGFPGAHALRARIKLLQDNPDSAMRESEQEADPFWKSYSRTLALAGQGNTDEALAQWNELQAGQGDAAAFQFAEIAASLGRTDEAFAWLEAARSRRDAGMRELLGNRFLEGLHGDPRWPQMLTELGLPLDVAGLND